MMEIGNVMHILLASPSEYYHFKKIRQKHIHYHNNSLYFFAELVRNADRRPITSVLRNTGWTLQKRKKNSLTITEKI